MIKHPMIIKVKLAIVCYLIFSGNSLWKENYKISNHDSQIVGVTVSKKNLVGIP